MCLCSSQTCLCPLASALAELDRVLLDRQLAAVDNQIVVIGDTRPDLPGETDALFIHPVGSADNDVRPEPRSTDRS